MTEHKEAFCPRCFDYHPFELVERDGERGAVCCRCEFACTLESLPHDDEEAVRNYPGACGL